MGDCIAYRGPDDHGIWSDPDVGIALTHQRLSILDLSPAGHMPMSTADGTATIAYNGEIYNYHELRQELETAAEPAQCDRIAQKAGQAMEQGIMGLMQALRGQNWQQANATLVELDGLEGILDDVRSKRAEMTLPR